MTSTVLGRDTAGQGDLAIDDPQGPGKRYSRLFGALFIAGFLVYGIGFGLVSSVTTAPDFMATLSAHSTTLVIGAFLMLLNTVVDIGKGVLFFPIAERQGKRTALVYLAAITVQVVLLDLGVLFLLLLVPMAEFALGAGASSATALGSLLIDANTLAYQLGQGTLAFGALFMTCVPVPDANGAPNPRRVGRRRLRDPSQRSHRRDLRDPCRAPDVAAGWLLRTGLWHLADCQGLRLHQRVRPTTRRSAPACGNDCCGWLTPTPRIREKGTPCSRPQ